MLRTGVVAGVRRRFGWRAAGTTAGVLAMVLAGTAAAQVASAAPLQAAHLMRHQDPVSEIINGLHVTLPCGFAVGGQAACTAVVNDQANASAAATPTGLSPSQIRSAYALPSTPVGGGSPTVAVVDAYNDPSLAADLATYRSYYGLPACTTASGCLKIVNQTGGSTLPTADAGWAEEESLDVDAVSAACPSCHILMVEASSTSIADLGTAVNTAASLGAVAISNSYGGSEDSSDAAASSSYYNHPGIAVTASAGDNGYGVSFPASSQYVTAVGGTTLTASTVAARGWTEAAWGSYLGQGTGSGCSAYIAKPSWQTAGITGGFFPCTRRSVADVSAVADPASGLAVYDTYGGQTGWLQVGGTSLSSPLIASVYALAGNTGPGKTAVNGANRAYANTSHLNDVTTGRNGICFLEGANACTAAVGYDGPTGLGTPNGVAAF